MLKLFYSFLRAFGFLTTWHVLILPKLQSKISKRAAYEIARPAVRKYVLNQIRSVVDQYCNHQKASIQTIKDDCPIWICWWQGWDEMPDLAKMCYRYVEQNKGKHQLIFIDKRNYKDYVNLPDIIFKRLQKGEMCITHFTDVLRFALLKQYGGIWLDALILVIKPLNLKNQVFYSLKHRSQNNKYVSNSRWAGGVLACEKDCILASFVYESYLSYWSRNHKAIDHMLMDYIIDIGYEEVGAIKKMVDDVEFNNLHFYKLKSIFNQKVDLNLIETILQSDTALLSLNRRLHCEERDGNNQLTFYGYFNQKI